MEGIKARAPTTFTFIFWRDVKSMADSLKYNLKSHTLRIVKWNAVKLKYGGTAADAYSGLVWQWLGRVQSNFASIDVPLIANIIGFVVHKDREINE